MRALVKASNDVLASLAPGDGSAPRPLTLGALDVVVQPAARSDLLVQHLERRELPEELVDMGMADEFTSDFETQLSDPEISALVLSILPEIEEESLWRHREQGYLVRPSLEWESRWNPEQRAWFEATFAPTGPISPEESLENLVLLARRLSEKGTQILLFNCSSFDPEDETHAYSNVGETLALRIHKLNLVALRVSQLTGASLVDVDRLIAELGAGRHVTAALSYSDEANRAIRGEVERILRDRGLVALRDPDGDLALLHVPSFDRRVRLGTIVRWHKREGDQVHYGDKLFDIQAEGLRAVLDFKRALPLRVRGVTKKRVLTLSVIAADEGVLGRIEAEVGSQHSVGDRVAVLTASPDVIFDEGEADSARAFRALADVVDDG